LEFERRAGGKLIHARGPATANAQSPIDARCRLLQHSGRENKAGFSTEPEPRLGPWG